MPTTLRDGWELVVGLEVHVELNTNTKMWCGCATDFGGEPNTRVCPVCTGQPGALPVVNGVAVESAARLGLALNCSVVEDCRFHRKNYFYPDMPKNYQISQYDVPLCSDGFLEVEVEGEEVRVGIERLHMEEDTGKSMHMGDTGRLHGADRSLIDYNRAGIPLLEIVSHPDIRDPETAQAYLRELQGIVQTLGVSDARMEEGSIRCDANVSVRRPGEELGTRREIKNLNSIRSLGRAIAYEAEDQIATLEDGGTIVMETRHWDEEAGVTSTLRRKETVADYRYFPDPDLVEVHAAPEWVEALRQTLPELPAASRKRLADAGIPDAQATTIVGSGMIGWYDHAAASGADPRVVANWLAGEVTGQIAAAGLDPASSGLTGAHVAELVTLIDEGRLSNKLAKDVLDGVIESRGAKLPSQVASERGLEQVSDEGELRAIVDRVVADNPDVVEKIKGGADKAIGALVGQVMQATKGQANPGLANQLLRDAIDER
ncbi:MAG: Asp-tRNA(Asn)/Glu-tRNA(Gln) amidotransferase subunit GatB [Actinobacteria bacterium]|nr:Asp-tRNA(Asn)/Glu-tRNA(Gln) amidotransferase subunit GatB [Actinomycetota bacterium]